MRGLDREELLLDDLLAADLLGLLQEDVGDGRRVGRRVVAAAALLGEAAQEGVGAAAARAHRRRA